MVRSASWVSPYLARFAAIFSSGSITVERSTLPQENNGLSWGSVLQFAAWKTP